MTRSVFVLFILISAGTAFTAAPVSAAGTDKAATVSRGDPYHNFRFKLDINGVTVGAFSDVSGFDTSVSTVEYREGEQTITPRKLPGLKKFSNIALKKGVSNSPVLPGWVKSVAAGKVERKTIVITMLDENGKDGASWKILNAWPVKHAVSDFKGAANETLYESIELAHEGMTRIK